MKKKAFKMAIWIVAGIVVAGLRNLVLYLVTMSYSSNVAPAQVDDDASYAILRTQSTTETIISFVFLVVIVLIIIKILRIALKETPPVAS